MFQELYNNIKATPSLNGSTVQATGTGVGASVDLLASGPWEACAVICSLGTYTNGTHTFALEDSPDGTTWTAVGTTLTQGTAVGTASGFCGVLGYKGTARYLHALDVVTSGATGAAAGGMVVTLAAKYRGAVATQ